MSTSPQDMAHMPQKRFNSTREALLASIDHFKGKNPKATDESIGWAAAKDSSIVNRLRNGGDCGITKLDAIIRYLSNPNRKV